MSRLRSAGSLTQVSASIAAAAVAQSDLSAVRSKWNEDTVDQCGNVKNTRNDRGHSQLAENLGASPSNRLRPVADPLTDPDPCALTADGCTVFFYT